MKFGLFSVNFQDSVKNVSNEVFNEACLQLQIMIKFVLGKFQIFTINFFFAEWEPWYEPARNLVYRVLLWIEK